MKSGQTLLEYVLVFAALIVLASILWGFVQASGQSAIRTENLVSSEYP